MEKSRNPDVAVYISPAGEVLQKRRITGYKHYEKIIVPFGSHIYVCMRDSIVDNIDFDLETMDIRKYDKILHYIVGVEPILLAVLNVQEGNIVFYNKVGYSAALFLAYKQLFPADAISECKYFAVSDYDSACLFFNTVDEFRLTINYVLSSSNLIAGVVDASHRELCKICNYADSAPYMIINGGVYTQEKVCLFIDMFNGMY